MNKGNRINFLPEECYTIDWILFNSVYLKNPSNRVQTITRRNGFVPRHDERPQTKNPRPYDRGFQNFYGLCLALQ